MPKTGAQALLEAVITRSLAPILKAEGYRRAGSTFRRQAERCVQVLNVQSAPRNTRNDVRFTINLGAFYPDVHKVLVSLRQWEPSAAGPKEYECQVRSRLGALLPDPQVFWWHLASEQPAAPTALELETGVRDHGLPWLARMSKFDVARANADNMSRVAFAVVAGDHDEARALVAEFLPEGSPAVAAIAWAKQLGLR